MNRVPPREHLRAAYAQLLVRTGSLGRATRSLRQRALVLMYHRVLNDTAVPDDIDPGMYVTRSTFERHLKYLAANHDVVGFDAFRRWLLGQTTFPRIPCVITFDDGWGTTIRRRSRSCAATDCPQPSSSRRTLSARPRC